MCGIVGYIGSRNATEVLIEGLSKLEYRGYDSAGVALAIGPDIKVVKAKGRLAVLKKKLESIRAAVENLEFPEYPGLRITVSIGGAHAVGPLADTVQKADQALYHAKAAKNRTVLYKEDLQ